jgi:quercetin dioxygenase-like cupin family protein
MERRELLSLGGMAAIAGAFSAAVNAPAQEGAPAGGKRVLRVYADADGNSQIEELPIATRPGRIDMAKTVPLTGMTYAEYKKSGTEDWHRSPGRQFSISLSGEIEVEVSGGKKHAIHAGDIVFLEDQKGKGHVTRILTPVNNIFLRVADGFDVVAWSRGES